MSALPSEIIQSVVAHLGGDKRVLAIASLACSQFRVYCQEVLFSNIFVDCDSGIRVRGLLRCIGGGSPLLGYIKSLTVSLQSFRVDKQGSGPLRELLDILGGLQLTSFKLLTQPLVWRLVLPELPSVRKALEKLSRLPSLISLSLFCAPTQWVMLCSPNLRFLSLSVIWNDRKSKPNDGHEALPCRLQVLEIDHDPVSFAYVLDQKKNKISLEGLERLKIKAFHTAQPPELDIGILLSGCNSSLKTLTCDSLVLQFGLKTPVDLSGIANLQRIEITCTNAFYDHQMNRQNPYGRWLPDLLITFQPENTLEEIQIGMLYNEGENLADELQFWLMIDEILSNATRFPKLQHLTVSGEVASEFVPTLEQDLFPDYRRSGREFVLSVFEPRF